MNRAAHPLLVLAALALTLPGCASPARRAPSSNAARAQDRPADAAHAPTSEPSGALVVAPAPSVSRPRRLDLLLAPPPANLTAACGAGEPVSLSASDAPLEDVLRLVARACGRRIVLDAGAERAVDLSVTEVPLADALARLLAQEDLVAWLDGSALRVGPPPLAITAFRLPAAGPDPPVLAGGADELVSSRGRVSLDTEAALLVVRDVPARIDAIERLLEELCAAR